MEVVRKRRHAPLGDILFERAPDGTRRKSGITVALEALRAVQREAHAQPGRAQVLAVHPEIAAALSEGEGLAARTMLETQLGRPLAVAARPLGAREAFDIRSG
jgi:Ribonuclease G/E